MADLCTEFSDEMRGIDTSEFSPQTRAKFAIVDEGFRRMRTEYLLKQQREQAAAETHEDNPQASELTKEKQ